MGFLSKRWHVESFHPIHALNGIACLLVISAIPVITSATGYYVTSAFVVFALIIGTIVTALGTEPFKRGILNSIFTWVLNSGIFLVVFLAFLHF